MRLSTRGRYGLRAMTELAGRYGEGPVLVGTIAARQQVPANYIHVLMGALKSAGLVRSVRGPGGGYELARPPDTITALDVVGVLEGACVAVDCTANASVCPRADSCAARELWGELAAAVQAVLGRHTLASLAERQRLKSGAAKAGMFHI